MSYPCAPSSSNIFSFCWHNSLTLPYLPYCTDINLSLSPTLTLSFLIRRDDTNVSIGNVKSSPNLIILEI